METTLMPLMRELLVSWVALISPAVDVRRLLNGSPTGAKLTQQRTDSVRPLIAVTRIAE